MDTKHHTIVRVICGLLMISIGLSLFWLSNARASERPSQPQQRKTDWRVVSSMKFDALCFLNVMTGDPFYLKYYQKEYAEFEPRLTPAAGHALADLKRKLKDENHNLVSAFLCLYFSATDDESIEDMLKTLDHREGMKGNLRRTVYFNETGWQLFESIRPELKTALAWLNAVGFPDYWRQEILPTVERRKETFEKNLSSYDVIPEVEKHLGFSLTSNTITICLLYFAQPHGIRVTGTRFIADISYPLRVVLQNAIHEMMHPPYSLSSDRELREALATLKADTFLMAKVLHHNPSFGYNSFDGFVEEDCVRALEQVVTENLNLSREAHRRWLEEDEGMHVLAVALYSLMKQEHRQAPESFRDFVVRMVKTRKLSPGRIEPIYKAFYEPAS
jgi:hypothetical protein